MNINPFLPLEKSLYPGNLKYLNDLVIKLLILSGLFLLALDYFTLLIACSSPHWISDYIYLYISGEQALKQEDFYYPIHFFKISNLAVVNLNPPIIGVLMIPLRFLNYSASFFVWNLLSLILGFSSLFLIVKNIFQPKTYIVYAMSALFMLAYFPVFLNAKFGQVGMIILFLITMGWLSFRENKMRSAGVFWGIAFSIKLFVGLIFYMLLIRKEWRCLKFFFLTSVGCGMFSLLIYNPDIYFHYFNTFKLIRWYTSNWNASLFGFFARLFGCHEHNYVVFNNAPLVTSIIYSLSVIGLLLTFFYFKKQPNYKKLSNDLAVAYTIVLMLLISPLGGIYYFPLLLIAFIVIYYWNQRIFQINSVYYLSFVALLFSSVPCLFMGPHQITDIFDVFLSSGYYCYALCILGIIIFKLNYCLAKKSLYLRSQPHMESRIVLTIYAVALLPSFIGILQVTQLILLAI